MRPKKCRMFNINEYLDRFKNQIWTIMKEKQKISISKELYELYYLSWIVSSLIETYGYNEAAETQQFQEFQSLIDLSEEVLNF